VRRLADEVEWALTMQDVTPLCMPVAPPPVGAPLEVPKAQMRAHGRSDAGHGDDDGRDCRTPEGIDATIEFRSPAAVVALFRQAINAFATPGDLPWRACERLLTHVEAEWTAQPRHRDPIFARDGYVDDDTDQATLGEK